MGNTDALKQRLAKLEEQNDQMIEALQAIKRCQEKSAGAKCVHSAIWVIADKTLNTVARTHNE